MSLTTKRALAESLKKLLSKKNLDKITVKDIVTDCGVNRQTFYYRFHDLYALTEWALRDEVESLFGENTDYSDWGKCVCILMAFLQENRTMVRNIYYSVHHRTVAECIRRILRPYVFQLVQVQAEEMNPKAPEDDMEYVTKILTLSTEGIITEWIDSGQNQVTEELLRKFQAAICGNIPLMLRNLNEYRERADHII